MQDERIIDIMAAPCPKNAAHGALQQDPGDCGLAQPLYAIEGPEIWSRLKLVSLAWTPNHL
jgi:hypothetical protein